MNLPLPPDDDEILGWAVVFALVSVAVLYFWARFLGIT